jgi:hypothetical protein
MKQLGALAVLLALLLVGCSQPVKIDGTSQDRYEATLLQMTRDMSEAELKTFFKDAGEVVARDLVTTDVAKMSIEEIDKRKMDALHGMTLDDIRRTAKSLRP